MYDELIARLEAAKEGSRDLDAHIRFVVVGDMTRCNFDEMCYHGDCKSPGCGQWIGIHDGRRIYPNRWEDDERLPQYTTSIDAALTLVPEGWNKGFCENDDGTWYAELRYQWRTSYSDLQNSPLKVLTPALALCIAALKARRASTNGT